MHPLTGKELKDKIRGSGLRLQDVAKRANVCISAASRWYNGKQDIYLEATYNRLVTAYEELKKDDD